MNGTPNPYVIGVLIGISTYFVMSWQNRTHKEKNNAELYDNNTMMFAPIIFGAIIAVVIDVFLMPGSAIGKSINSLVSNVGDAVAKTELPAPPASVPKPPAQGGGFSGSRRPGKLFYEIE